MKQKLLVGVLLVILIVVSSQVFAEYDREAVVSAMRSSRFILER